jgi:phenylacetate-CoA ligase
MKGHRTLTYLREFEKSQFYPPEQVANLQSKKLGHFVSYIYDHVPYYKNLFDTKGIKPDSIESLEDLAKVPFLTKESVRREMENLKSSEAKNLQRFNTGGSTGAPMIFYVGTRRISHDVAAKVRATRWWGVDVGDPEIVIWGSPVELNKQDVIRNMRDRLFRTRLLSAFNMGADKMDEYIAVIREFRPKHIFGYPSSICLLSEYAKEKKIKLDDCGVKVIFCTAEKLYKHQREFISSIFDAPVANGYGGRDSGFIAHECPEASGMHITAESIIVEVIDNEGNPLPAGQRGEIVITHLDTQDFPFIRYKTGDIGVLSSDSCTCGRGLPLLESIDGRSTDFIICPDGKIMHGLSLIYVLRNIAGIKEFKIIQDRTDSFIISIVREPDFQSDDEQLIMEGFKKRVGGDIAVEINYVPAIEAESSGKFRYVVSNVDRQFD